ncbi:DUF3857 domain-containing protein [Flavobacterium antarcticum]|uniref:DUF3857 domain-containing protein n=1 Tax=Flavobacterium antarcticum TaxID=271155 RepID=UPI0003B4EB78|nr:DUF3857 domain-containing protein [Flavobacterium antarcticum]
MKYLNTKKVGTNVLKKMFFIGILLGFISVNAQEFELGKVSVKELEEKEHPKDSSAIAALLYNKGKTYFKYTDKDGFTIVTEVEARLKIYKKEGYDWATKAVEFYIGSNPVEQVWFSKAITYNLVDGKIEKTKLKSDGEFKEKKNKFWGLSKMTMPNVKEGSVIEYRYTIESPFIGTFPEWKFQDKIPVNYSEYTTDIPEYYKYNSFFKGFLTPVVTKSFKSNSVVINAKQRNGSLKVSTSFSNDKIEFQSNVVKYVIKNIDAAKDEEFVTNIENYSSSVMHELASQNFPNMSPKSYATDWESIVKTIYEDENFGGELNKKNYFEEDLNAVLSNVTDKNQKLLAIFEFVKGRMNWNKYNGYYCNEGVKIAYKQKTGNSAEINLMLTAMLKNAGFNARPVLVSTRSNGIAFFPNKSAYNYVITAVEDGDIITLLDASDKYSLPNQIPFRALNWFGRLIRADGSSETIDLMPKIISKEKISLTYKIDQDGSVSGKIRKIYSDYNAQIFRSAYVGLNDEQYLEKLENTFDRIQISAYERNNEQNIYEPIQENFSFTGGDFSDVVGGKIFVSPLLFLGSKKNPFDQEKREYPVDFGFPFQDKFNIVIEIPEGYMVESIPTSAHVKMESNSASFKYLSQINGNQILLSITHDLEIPIVNPIDYPSLKDFYKQIVEKQMEKIVLKKI